MEIRNAFVVSPAGEVEQRAYNEKWSPLVNSLENLRDGLRGAARLKADGDVWS